MTKREKEVLDAISQTVKGFSNLLHGYRVVLFGSRAAGTASPTSDFDIGVIGSSPLQLRAFYDIADRLDSLRTLYRIDWVDLRRSPDTFRLEALKCSQVLYDDTTTGASAIWCIPTVDECRKW